MPQTAHIIFLCTLPALALFAFFKSCTSDYKTARGSFIPTLHCPRIFLFNLIVVFVGRRLLSEFRACTAFLFLPSLDQLLPDADEEGA